MNEKNEIPEDAIEKFQVKQKWWQKVKPGGKRDAQIARMENVNQEVFGLVRSIRDNLDAQIESQNKLVHFMSALPEVADGLKKVGESTEYQKEMLGVIKGQMEQTTSQNVKIAGSIDTFSSTLNSMDNTTKSILDGSREREDNLKDMLERSERRSNVLMTVLFLLLAGALLFGWTLFKNGSLNSGASNGAPDKAHLHSVIEDDDLEEAVKKELSPAPTDIDLDAEEHAPGEHHADAEAHEVNADTPAVEKAVEEKKNDAEKKEAEAKKVTPEETKKGKAAKAEAKKAEKQAKNAQTKKAAQDKKEAESSRKAEAKKAERKALAAKEADKKADKKEPVKKEADKKAETKVPEVVNKDAAIIDKAKVAAEDLTKEKGAETAEASAKPVEEAAVEGAEKAAEGVEKAAEEVGKAVEATEEGGEALAAEGDKAAGKVTEPKSGKKRWFFSSKKKSDKDAKVENSKKKRKWLNLEIFQKRADELAKEVEAVKEEIDALNEETNNESAAQESTPAE